MHSPEVGVSSEAYFTADDGVKGAYHRHYGQYQTVRHDDNAMEPVLRRLTICVLVLTNGDVIVGKSLAGGLEGDGSTERKRARADAMLGLARLQLGLALSRLQDVSEASSQIAAAAMSAIDFSSKPPSCS